MTVTNVRARRGRSRGVLPGFAPAMGFTLFYLALIVLIPLSAAILRAAGLGWDGFWTTVTTPRVLAALRLSFGAALAAALLNAAMGLLTAWVLVRYRFPGRRLLDAVVDMPFAMPTAVSGIALATVFSPNAWLGQYLKLLGIQVAFTPLGVVVALVFIGLPFVVRTIQPVLEDIEAAQEEAALSLGASSWQVFRRITLPALVPALLTGFALALARGIGEYGSVIFIAGNIPMVSEIAPLLIVTKMEEFDYAQATAIASAMLLISLLLLLTINGLQWWHRRRETT